MSVETVDYFSDDQNRPPVTEGVLLVYDVKSNEICIVGQKYNVSELKDNVLSVQVGVSAGLKKLLNI